MTRKTEKMLRAAMLKSDRVRIERAYQRAMDIRDSQRAATTISVALAYDIAYRKAYKLGTFFTFRQHTRQYLKALRNARLTSKEQG